MPLLAGLDRDLDGFDFEPAKRFLSQTKDIGKMSGEVELWVFGIRKRCRRR